MDVLATYKSSLTLFKKTFIPLFMITSVFPLLELLVRPSLEHYVILNSISVFDLLSFLLTLLVVCIGYIALDTLYTQGRLNIKEIFAKAFDVMWPLFLFQLIWMLFIAIMSLFKALPPIFVLVLFAGVIYLSVRVSMTVILIVIEKESVAKAFDRSFVMTKGKFWSIFSIYLLLILSVFSVMIVLFLFIAQPFFQVETVTQMFQLIGDDMQMQLIFNVFVMTVVSQLVYVTMYMIYKFLTPSSPLQDDLLINEVEEHS